LTFGGTLIETIQAGIIDGTTDCPATEAAETARLAMNLLLYNLINGKR
jgi:hypothetical protein